MHQGTRTVIKQPFGKIRCW